MADRGWVRRHAATVTITVFITVTLGTVLTGIYTSPGFRHFVLERVPSAIGSFFGWWGEPVQVARWHYWLLAVIAMIVIGGLLLLGVVLFRGRGIPTVEDYTEDVFFGITWRWGYTALGQIDVDSITPYCPHCDRLLPHAPQYSSDTFTVYHCTACGKMLKREGHARDVVAKVVREIELHARKGTWQNKVKAKAA